MRIYTENSSTLGIDVKREMDEKWKYIFSYSLFVHFSIRNHIGSHTRAAEMLTFRFHCSVSQSAIVWLWPSC